MNRKTILFSILGCLIILTAASCRKKANDSVIEDSILKKEIFIKNEKLCLENFRKALNEMNKPMYHPTKEYTEKYGDELSPERKAILFEPAKELIFATGISEEQLQEETKGEVDKILSKALKLYASKTSLVSNHQIKK